MLTCFAFQLGSPTLKHILQVLIKRYIDKKAALEKICKCKFMNFPWPETSGRCFQNNCPCFLILEERELPFTSPTQYIKFKHFNKKTLLVFLIIIFFQEHLQIVVQTFAERMLGFIRTKNCKILWELLHGIYIRDEQI